MTKYLGKSFLVHYGSDAYREGWERTFGAETRMKRIVWLTGLSGSGKTVIAHALAEWLARHCGRWGFVIDGDELRAGLCKDLGYGEDARLENMRRAAHVARLVADRSVLVPIVALISPLERHRQQIIDDILGREETLLVHVACPLSVCVRRDPKGLYAAKTPLMTGVDSPYEPPANPDVTVHTDEDSIERCVSLIGERFIWVQR